MTMRTYSRGALFFVSVVLLLLPPHVLSQPRFETIGHWRVTAVHHEMDAVSHVILRTTFASTERAAIEGQNVEGFFGFRIFGGSLMTLDAPSSIGRNYWPHCDLNLSTYSISGSSPQLIATRRRGGSCNAIPMDGELIKAFQTGDVARVRVHRQNGYISLHGFAAAWERARELAQ